MMDPENKTVTGSAGYLFAACEADVGNPWAKLILIALANRANDEGACWPTRERIAQDSCCSVSTVKRSLAILADLAFIEVEEQFRNNIQIHSRYHLRLGVFRSSLEGQKEAAPAGSERTGAGSERTTETPNKNPISTDVLIGGKSKKRGSRIPDDFEVTETMLDWVVLKGFDFLDLGEETERFMDYHTAKGSVMKDWQAAWRTWIRNAVKYSKRGQSNGTRGTDSAGGDRRGSGKASAPDRVREAAKRRGVDV